MAFFRDGLEPKANCFAYNVRGKNCRILHELICTQKSKCSFYKHRADVDIAQIERDIRNYTGPKA